MRYALDVSPCLCYVLIGLSIDETIQTKTSRSNIAGKCILVVDDEEDILFAMQHLLSSWGSEVIVADSPESALQQLNRKQRVPDFIVSDLRLRDGEEGDELIELVRQEYNKDIPAVLVTGDTAPKRVKRIKESGLTVLYKPVEPDDLFFALNQALGDLRQD